MGWGWEEEEEQQHPRKVPGTPSRRHPHPKTPPCPPIPAGAKPGASLLFLGAGISFPTHRELLRHRRQTVNHF